MSEFILEAVERHEGFGTGSQGQLCVLGEPPGSRGADALRSGQGPGRPERAHSSGVGAMERKGRLQRALAVKWTEPDSSVAWAGWRVP